MFNKKLVLLLLIVACGQRGPMERIEESQDQRLKETGSLATLVGKKEGFVFNLKGAEHISAFSKTTQQKNLYQKALLAMQGYPYSVDPTGKTIYTDWFEDKDKKSTKITIFIQENDLIVNIFTKRNGQAVADKTKSLNLKKCIEKGSL